MAAPMDAPLAPFFTLKNGFRVVVTAISATTGAEVAGVVVSGVSLAIDPSMSGAVEFEQPEGPIFLVPGPATV